MTYEPSQGEFQSIQARLGPSAGDILPLFVDRFLETANLSKDRAESVSSTVRISVADGEIRVELPIVGGTKWFRWDGSLEDLGQKLLDAAYEFGAEVDWERKEFGSTPWDAPIGSVE